MWKIRASWLYFQECVVSASKGILVPRRVRVECKTLLYVFYSFFSFETSAGESPVDCTFCSSLTNLQNIPRQRRLTSNSDLETHHFTLAHRHSSIPIKATKCRFPFVMTASVTSTNSRNANAPSRMSWNVGWRDDPGVRMLERKSVEARFSCESGGNVTSDIVNAIRLVFERRLWVQQCYGSVLGRL